MTSYDGQTGNIVIVAIIGANGDYRSDAAFCEFDLNGTTIPTTSSQWRTHSFNNKSNGNSRNAALQRSTTVTPGTNTSRSWSIRSGSTPSSSTGPDKHHDNNSSSTYIYYEASGGSTSIATGYIIRTRYTHTI
jgi:hypothetical protein